jgi:hypothetical protein
LALDDGLVSPMRHSHKLWLASVAALLAACSAATEPSVVEGNLRETATIEIDSSGVRTFRALLTLENLSSSDQPIVWGEDCALNGPVDVRMFRGSQLVWESSRVASLRGCPMQLIQSTISAKGSAGFEWRMPVRDILGDSLAEGDYTFTVQSGLESPTLTKQVSAGGLRMADPIAVPPGTNLNGTWTGMLGPVSISLVMTWTADSVHGSGTFALTGPQPLFCGGAAPSQSGTVTYAAHRSNDVVAGVLSLGVGYAAPFGGRLRSASELDGTIMNVDTPGCALILNRTQ